MEKAVIETNKVYLGDCSDLIKRIKPKSVDLIFTSPPYNMNLRIKYGQYLSRQLGENSFANKYEGYTDNLSMKDYCNWSVSVLEECLRVSKLTFYNVQMITGNKPALFKTLGYFSDRIKELIIWDKGHGQPAMQEGILNSRFEILLVLSDSDAISRNFNPSFFNRGELDNLWNINRGHNKYQTHGAVFPIELAKKVISNFTRENDIVLDIFGGTGTTGVAAMELNRRFILFEKHKPYYDISVKRLQDTMEKLGQIKTVEQVETGKARQLGLF